MIADIRKSFAQREVQMHLLFIGYRIRGLG